MGYLQDITDRGKANAIVVNKFGRAPGYVDSGQDTDIWDLDQPVWLAPTAARVHAIVSSSANDDLAGSGAQTVRVYGLKTWASAETSEDIDMDGATPVNTANSYVIIHRMKVLTSGGTTINAGIIKATAASDATITAQILAGEGQTQMAIYGVPTGYSFYMSQYYASMIKNAAATELELTLLVNPEPDSQTTQFLTKHTQGLDSTGSSFVPHRFSPSFKIEGPAIIKVRGNAGANTTDVSAGFDGVLVNESLSSYLH